MKNLLIAEALLELAKNSTTRVIDVAEDKELIESAARLGIVVPSPDLAIIKTIYAEIDKVNRNGVVLPREAVEKGLPTLVGKQVNWEHLGSGQVCGYTIDAKIVDDKIEIIAVVFKSLFPEEFETVIEKFQKGTLAVSFEIWNRDPLTGESVLTDLEDGIVEISTIIFHGTGLLLTSQPACPKAKVYKLFANSNNGNEIKFNENLVYAKMATKDEEGIVEELKNTEEQTEIVKAEEIKSEENKETAEEKIEEVKEEIKEEKTEELAAETKVEETKEEAEVKPEEVKTTTPEETKEEAEVKPETSEEAAVITRKEEIVQTDELNPGEEVITTEVKVEEIHVNDEGKETMKREEETKAIVTYTLEEVESKVADAKAEMQIVIDEKDKEIAKLKQELESKSQEIEKASVKEETLPELSVGNVTTANDEYKERQEKLNLKAFGHR